MHRRLLEEREEELKVGAVLLLKQVKPASAPSLNLRFPYPHVAVLTT